MDIHGISMDNQYKLFVRFQFCLRRFVDLHKKLICFLYMGSPSQSKPVGDIIFFGDYVLADRLDGK